MLTKGYTYQALNAFKKFVIQQSRSRLTKGKSNVSKKLYNSIDGEVKVNPNSFELSFSMLEYGAYLDKGVKGTKSNYIVNKNSPFSYKQSSNLIGLEAKTGTFAKWAKEKNIRLRDSQGRFKAGNYKTIGFILARSIKEKGLKASLFFTKPFEQGFKKLPDQLIEAYGLDVEQLLETALNNEYKNKR